METMVTRFLSLALVAALVAPSCSKPPCGVEVCDISKASCQQMAARAAACFRDEAPVDVPVRILSRAAASFPPETDPAALERFRVWTRAWALYGLAREGATRDDAASARFKEVGAYYSSDTREITIVDDGYGLAWRGAVAMLIHEYVHALQDRQRTDTATTERSLDSLLAVRSVIEGEATMIEDRANLALFGTRDDAVPWDSLFAQWQAESRDAARRDDLPMTLAIARVPYAFGAPIARDLHAARGTDAVRSAIADPPRTTRRILGRAVGSQDEDAAAAASLIAEAVPNLPSAYPFYALDALGAWALEQFLLREGADDLARTAPLALAADTFAVNANAQHTTFVATWRLRFDNKETARAVASAIGQRGSFAMWTASRDVVMIASNDPAAVADADAGLTFGAPPKETPSAFTSRPDQADSPGCLRHATGFAAP
jgi:hypothetical protein